MQQIKMEFENCFGISKLVAEFCFQPGKSIYNIYAPNGTMKTSFAKSLKCLERGEQPQDLIYPDKEVKMEITKSNGESLNASEVFVVESYNSSYQSENLNLLIHNQELKKQYDGIQQNLEVKKQQLLTNLNSTNMFFRYGRDKIESQISTIFGSKILYENLAKSLDKLEAKTYPEFFQNLKYKDLTDQKIQMLLSEPGIHDTIVEYMQRYDELIVTNDIFEKGKFDHINVTTIKNHLQKNNFFEAGNKLVLKNGKTVQSEEELTEIVKLAMEEINSDSNLKTIFDKLDPAFERNEPSRQLKQLLKQYPELIPYLKSFSELKQSLLISTLQQFQAEIEELVGEYQEAKEKLQQIIETAKSEMSEWQEVVTLYNSRFDVPFTVAIGNQQDVILKQQKPVLKFNYNQEREVDEVKLQNVLSMGEKRALYLLNVIFEIEARKKLGKDTLIIIDDIADSFDYKNKYAIIEYLYDIKETSNLNMIILTHNFDFYRTVQSRLGVARSECKMVSKDETAITLIQGGYLKDVFSNWRNRVSEPKVMIAAIPFVRNLSEYLYGMKSESFEQLTTLLHWKQNTSEVTVANLQLVYKEVWQNEKPLPNQQQKVVDVIFDEAEEINNSQKNDQVNLEDKLILSIASRLYAEKIMTNADGMGVIKDEDIGKTRKLVEIYKQKTNSSSDQIKLLEQVVMMTPENIHLNSFMYEPILDLSNHHLKKLYQGIKIWHDEIFTEARVR
ncbi:MAG: hypothetical protein ACRC17_06135 [Culicoidibacterales bacterium]